MTCYHNIICLTTTGTDAVTVAFESKLPIFCRSLPFDAIDAGTRIVVRLGIKRLMRTGWWLFPVLSVASNGELELPDRWTSEQTYIIFSK